MARWASPLAAHHRSASQNDLRDLRTRVNRHIRRNSVIKSSCLAFARALAIECAGTIDDTWRANGLEHPGERRNRVAGVFFYLTDRTNCVVRLGLFFDGDRAAAARILASPSAKSGVLIGNYQSKRNRLRVQRQTGGGNQSNTTRR